MLYKNKKSKYQYKVVNMYHIKIKVYVKE